MIRKKGKKGAFCKEGNDLKGKRGKEKRGKKPVQ